MDRETRRANLKKLQPATTKLRTTRSSKAVTATTTLSEYFNSQDTQTASQEAEQRPVLPENPANDELCGEPKNKKSRECQDTKPATQSKPKKAPKLKSGTTTRRGRGTGRGRSKQQSSISDFLRNEQIFSEVTAQHCLADNFSPDDIEMALALSKSEAEKYGVLRLEDTLDREQQEDEVINLLDNKANDSTENVRRKLQKYGFRTAAKEDYKMLSIGVLPGIAGKRGKRCKWANKFTALTLRVPEEQLKKRDSKVAALMAQQVRTKLPTAQELQIPPWELISTRLEALKPTAPITHEPGEESLTNLSAYYVEELFEVSKTPANHLLKSFAAIQGRDLSPKRPSQANLLRHQRLQKVYAELEAYFSGSPETIAEQAELDELELLVADNMVEETEKSLSMLSSPMKEPPDKRAKMNEEEGEEEEKKMVEEGEHVESSSLGIERSRITEKKEDLPESSLAAHLEGITEEKENLELRSSTLQLDRITEEKENVLPSSSARQLGKVTVEKENPQTSNTSLQQNHRVNTDVRKVLPQCSSSIPTQTRRCPSPDLFADSDGSEEELTIPASLGVVPNFSLSVYKNTTSKDINCYEIYSSDEVKMQPEITVQQQATKSDSSAPFVESFVDLTQEQESPELPLKENSENSLLEQPIFDLYDDVDELNCTLSHVIDNEVENCVIADELLAKYAYKADEQQEHERISPRRSSLSLNKSSSSASSFQMPIPSPIGFKDTTTTSATFLSASKEHSLSLPRSFSLTQTSNLEHSFKSPLSRKSNSFTDKSHRDTYKSPLSRQSDNSQTDASIDLTQDSGDDEPEDDCVLLSDDEINYSIWQADKTQRNQEQALQGEDCISPLSKRKTMPYFQTLDDLDAYLDKSPNQSALSRERAQFGIMDAVPSQLFTLSQLGSETADASPVQIDWTEASFLDTPTALPMKRYSSSSHKFKELLDGVQSVPQAADDVDEFDRLVYQNAAAEAALDTVPSGMDRLLLGEINLDSLPESAPPALPSNPPALPDKPEQLEVNGQLYTVRVCTSPKPDYRHMSEAELLQHLYKYGVKPLKRKHAVKLLEFIYNQTHPVMLPLGEAQGLKDSQAQRESQPVKESQVRKESKLLPRSKSTPVAISKSKTKPPLPIDCPLPSTPSVESPLTYKFRDASGHELLRFSAAVPPALCDDFECYVLQTNVTKKTPQPLLPLHIAWHNLICANPSLHESVLMFEPIDLQEIYQYLKQMGHRYDPKDLKCFFDRRCIIFRYELAPPTAQNRHVRKKPNKPSSKF